MKIALDLEDVLVDTNNVFVKEANSFIAREFPESQKTISMNEVEWGMKKTQRKFADLMGWKSDIRQKFFHGEGKWKGYIPLTQEVWEEKPETIPPMEESLEEKVEKIKSASNGEIDLVTARKHVRTPIKNKIESLGLKDSFREIIVKTYKEELDYDIYIDDNPTLSDRLDKDRIQLVRERPWNNNYQLKKPHRRVSNLDEARQVVKNVE